jgi:hypothetical protein
MTIRKSIRLNYPTGMATINLFYNYILPQVQKMMIISYNCDGPINAIYRTHRSIVDRSSPKAEAEGASPSGFEFSYHVIVLDGTITYRFIALSR